MEEDFMMRVEMPYLKNLAFQLERINNKIDSVTNGWMTQKQFCTAFDIPESTFRLWRKSDQIVSKKIGKVVFVNVVKTMELAP